MFSEISVISFHKWLKFPLGRVEGSTALGGLDIPHGSQQSLIVLLAPHQDGPSEAGDVVTPPGPWSTSGPLFSQQNLYRRSFLEHSDHVAEPWQLRSIFAERLLDIQGFTSFTAAHFVAKYHATMDSSEKPHLCRCYLR